MNKIGLGSIIAMTLVSVANIRNLPNIASHGPELVFFVTLAAIFFLIPVALASGFLSSRHKETGGVYLWVRSVFPVEVAFLAAWLQWIENVFYYPVLLIFIAENFLSLFFDGVINSQYVFAVIPVVFIVMTYINTRGIFVSARLSRICMVLGLLLPVVLILMASAYHLLYAPVVVPQLHQLMPSSADNITQIVVSVVVMFCGIEIATVHAGDVEDAKKTYPRAIFLSSVMIYAFMILGALSLVIQADGPINEITGLISFYKQSFGSNNSVLVGFITLLILLGQIGGLNNWIISPVRSLQVAFSEHPNLSRHLPANPDDATTRLLWLQAALVMLICLIFLNVSTQVGYFIFNELIVLLYMPMYIIILLAMCVDHQVDTEYSLEIWGGRKTRFVMAFLGIGMCLFVMGLSLLHKPSQFSGYTLFEYQLMVGVPWLISMFFPFILGLLSVKGR